MNLQSEITGYEGGFQGAIVGGILLAIIGPLLQVLIKSKKKKQMYIDETAF